MDSGVGHGGVVLGLVWVVGWGWVCAARGDQRLVRIGLWGLVGAFVGARVVYGLAEGWEGGGALEWREAWLQWVSGKSVLGGLLGGWLGVEGGKRMMGYTEPTGDRFAVLVAGSMSVGRVGCLLHGCCLGIPVGDGVWSVPDGHGVHRWPSVQIELGFSAVCWGLLFSLRKAGWFRNQLFHLFLIAYGLFRAVHEGVRDTPRIFFGTSGCQIAALVMAVLGVAAYVRRARTLGQISALPRRQSG